MEMLSCHAGLLSSHWECCVALSAPDPLNQTAWDSMLVGVRCSCLVHVRHVDPVLTTSRWPGWWLHFIGEKLIPTEPGPLLCSFLQTPAHLLFGKCCLWEMRRNCNLEITLAEDQAQTAGPTGRQLIIRIPLWASEGLDRPGVYMHARLFGACKSMSDVNGTASFFCRGGIPRDVWMRRPAGLSLGKADWQLRREAICQDVQQPGLDSIPAITPLQSGWPT